MLDNSIQDSSAHIQPNSNISDMKVSYKQQSVMPEIQNSILSLGKTPSTLSGSANNFTDQRDYMLNCNSFKNSSPSLIKDSNDENLCNKKQSSNSIPNQGPTKPKLIINLKQMKPTKLMSSVSVVSEKKLDFENLSNDSYDEVSEQNPDDKKEKSWASEPKTPNYGYSFAKGLQINTNGVKQENNVSYSACKEQIEPPSAAELNEKQIHRFLDRLKVYKINVPVFIQSNQRIDSPEVRKELNAQKFQKSQFIMMKLNQTDQRLMDKPSFMLNRMLTQQRKKDESIVPDNKKSGNQLNLRLMNMTTQQPNREQNDLIEDEEANSSNNNNLNNNISDLASKVDTVHNQNNMFQLIIPQVKQQQLTVTQFEQVSN